MAVKRERREPVYGIAITSSERELLLRIVTSFAEGADSPKAQDVLKLLENAVPAGLVASLEHT
jgi:hypothetical protein